MSQKNQGEEERERTEKVIISDIKEGKGEMKVQVKGHGELFLKYLHTTVTERMNSKKERDELFEKIKEHDEYGEYKHEKIDKVFPTIHSHVPISVVKKMSKEYKFVSGGYKTQMKREFCNPGTWAEAEPEVITSLERKRTCEDLVEKIRKEVKEEVDKDMSEQYYTTCLNKIIKEGWEEELKKAKKEEGYMQRIEDTTKIAEMREEIEEHKKSIEENRGFQVEYDKKKRKFDVFVERDDTEEVLNPTRPLNYEEVRDKKWLFLDIEVPKFKREDSEVSWVGMVYRTPGSEKKEIHTLSPLKEKETRFKKYRIESYEHEEELVEGVKESIAEEDPYVISAFNNKFDLLKLREAGDFTIGDEGRSHPYMQATMKFFERIGIHGRECIDMMRWAQTMFDHLPNQKLETVGKEVLGGESFEKSLTYEELEELEEKANDEELCLEERIESSKTIASYLAEDVDVLIDLYESREFQTFLKDATAMTEKFRIPLSWIFYSTNSVNHDQKRVYFENVGVERDNIYKKNKRMIKEQNKCRRKRKKYLEEIIDVRNEPGVYKDVYKIELRTGHYLKDIIARRYKNIKNIRVIRDELEESEGHLEKFHPLRTSYLSDFETSLADWITLDWAKYKMLERKGLKRLETLEGMNKEETGSLYTAVAEKLQKNLNRVPGRKKVEDFINENFKESKITEAEVDKDFCEVLEIFLKKVRVAGKMGGNYLMKPEEVDNALHKMKKDLESFLKTEEDGGAELIHQNNQTLYVQAGREVEEELEKRSLEKIDSVLLTEEKRARSLGPQKVYYKKHRFYKGIKAVDHPTHILTNFEIETLGGVIDLLLEENCGEVLEFVEEQKGLLNNREITNKDLVLYTKSRDVYTCFEDGEKREFHTSKEKSPEKAPVFKTSDLCREFYNKNFEEESKTWWGEEEDPVYIMQVEDFEPDWRLYNQRIDERLSNILYRIVDEEELQSALSTGREEKKKEEGEKKRTLFTPEESERGKA